MELFAKQMLIRKIFPRPLILSVFPEGISPQEKCIEGHERGLVFAHAPRYICYACFHAPQTLGVSGIKMGICRHRELV